MAIQMTAILNQNGRVTIPAHIRGVLGLRSGDRVEFLEREKGQFTLVAVNGSVRDLKGLFRRPRRLISPEEIDAAIARGANGKVSQRRRL